MPKLIIKQDAGVASRQIRYAKWLSISGLLALLLVVVAAAVLFTKSPASMPGLEPPVLSSAVNMSAKSGYESMHSILGELSAEFESLSAQGVDDYQKNLKLLGKSESILHHLEKMAGVADELGLNPVEQEQLFNRQQFYKDYWQAKLHFRELRVSRFETHDSKDAEALKAATETTIEAEEASTLSVMAEPPKKKFQFAKPPEGMALPEGFCDLSNPDSCKPEPAVAETEAVDIEEAPKKKFQFAKPPEGMALPEGFCDLSNPDSCKPEPAVAETEPEAVDIEETPKKKFQFAKPPEGMALPEGFCDLSNPDSCKPEPAVAETEAVDIEEAPKKKFQFAKPPEGMALPEGFCDLSNPDSCKPEPAVAETEAVDIEEAPKKKFQFAKPPEGMALPEGFCDLSNPDSCKPEATMAAAEEAPKKKFQFAKPPEGMALPEGFCDLSNPGSCKPEVNAIQVSEPLTMMDAAAVTTSETR